MPRHKRPRPDRYEFAVLIKDHTYADLAAHYGVSMATIYEWLSFHRLGVQPIPFDDKVLMLKLHYQERWSIYKIFNVFSEEITTLTKHSVKGIIRPQRADRSTCTTYNTALEYHTGVHDNAIARQLSLNP